ncbi:MAG: ACT domain-containing protein, partial [Aeoliella sp.]
FMRDYFRHTSHVSFLTMRLCDLASPPPVVSRMLDPVLSQSITSDFRVGLREIAATQLGTARLEGRVGEAVRLVDLARVHGKRIAQETWYHVYRSAPGYSTNLDGETIGRFRDLLENPIGLGEALRRMHDLGILEKIIPDFSHARCLLQFNRYHKYTVDEHCIRAVDEVTRMSERSDQPGEVYRRLKRKWLLHLVLLLHDLGKGYTEDHSERGVEIAHRIGARLDLEEGATQLAARLIRSHLEMSHAAFRRDTSDPEFVRQFAEEVGDREQLDMLYLLTLADLAAVGPDVLNDWKEDVLGDLYRRMRTHLTDDVTQQEEDQSVALKQAVWQALEPEERDDPWFEPYYQALPRSLVTARQPAEVAEALRRFHALEPREGTAWGCYLPDSKIVEFTAGVSQGAGRGIFSAMAGVLSSRGMSILAADTALLEGDVLLLRYQATDAQSTGPTHEVRLQELSTALVDAIDSDQAPRFRSVWGSEQSKPNSSLTGVPIEVRLDEELSQDSLIIEVFAFDRLGLLYELARAVHDLGLNIRFAKIGTSLDQVVDVFYVTERDDSKPSGEERLAEIRDRLWEIIDSN